MIYWKVMLSWLLLNLRPVATTDEFEMDILSPSLPQPIACSIPHALTLQIHYNSKIPFIELKQKPSQITPIMHRQIKEANAWIFLFSTSLGMHHAVLIDLLGEGVRICHKDKMWIIGEQRNIDIYFMFPSLEDPGTWSFDVPNKLPQHQNNPVAAECMSRLEACLTRCDLKIIS